MDRTLLVVVVIVVVAVLSLPLVAQLAKPAQPEPAPVVETPKPKPKPAPAAQPKPAVTPQQLSQLQMPGNIQLPPGVQQAAPGQPQRVAAEVRGGAAPTLNAQNLVGSKWQFEGGSIQLWAGGRAVARHPQLPPEMQAQGIPGNWSVNGQWLRLSAMGYIVEAQIVGNQIIGPNGPIRRLR